MATLADVLIRLFKAHDIPCSVVEGWVLPYGQSPAIRCIWHPPKKAGAGCLDVEILLADGRMLIDRCAGLGEDNNAIMDGVQNFVLGSFPVLLASLYGKNDPEQVTTKRWSLAGSDWTAYIGNFSRRASEGIDIPVPKSAFTAIQSAIEKSAVSADLHWFRTFYCHISAQQVFEALMDNKPWPEGETALKDIPWEKCNGYYSVRNFLVLSKNGSSTNAGSQA